VAPGLFASAHSGCEGATTCILASMLWASMVLSFAVATGSSSSWTVPVSVKQLGNGLKVVISREAVTAAVTGEPLHNGQASRLYQSLVKQKQVAIEVSGSLNWPLGNPFEYNGPTLMTSFIVLPSNGSETAVLNAFDEVIAALVARGPDAAELARIQAKMRSDLYAQMERPVERASILAHAVLFDGNADRVKSGRRKSQPSHPPM